MPNRELVDSTPGETPTHERVQQLIEAERGYGTQGILRRWRASDDAPPPNRVVLTSDASGVKISRDNGTTAPAQVIVDGTAAGGNLAGTYPNPTLSVAIMDALIPPGTIWAYAVAGAPAGWLFCDGTTVSRTTYAKLFAVIGTTYNTGGEAGTVFRLPNLLGRVPLGISGTHAIGTSGGAETVAGPAHTHTGTHSHSMSHVHGSAGHSHGLESTHSHGMTDHSHGLNSHSHSLNGHQHTVDLAHDHMPGASTSTSPPNVGGTGTGGGVGATFADGGHYHQFDTPALGSTSATVAASGTTNAGNASGDTAGAGNYSSGSATTGLAGAGNTGGTTPGDTGGPSVASTATDATAPAAAYGGTTVPTMMPFVSIAYIIRSGA